MHYSKIRDSIKVRGAWDNEPDGPIFFEHAGLKCALKRNFGFAWCGYVAVPEGHPLYNNSAFADEERDLYDDLSVHGCVTYCGTGERLELPTLVGWVIGFDCLHAYDLAPVHMELEMREFPEWKYRDLEYVTNETKSLAEQLAKMLTTEDKMTKNTRRIQVGD